MTLLKSNKNGNSFPSLLSDFFDADRFFNNQWLNTNFDNSLPAVNIKETNEAFNVEFAAPGFSKADFKVSLDENLLTVSAEKQEESKQDKERFTRREFSYSSFSRSFTLPQSVNAEKIDAQYSEGILHLHIPKKQTEKLLAKKEIKVA